MQVFAAERVRIKGAQEQECGAGNGKHICSTDSSSVLEWNGLRAVSVSPRPAFMVCSIAFARFALCLGFKKPPASAYPKTPTKKTLLQAFHDRPERDRNDDPRNRRK